MDLQFEKMSLTEAKNYFQWFVSQIPVRLDTLREYVHCTAPTIKLDWTERSLGELGRWFDGQRETRTRTHEELSTERSKHPEWVHPFIQEHVLTGFTLSLCVDLGIYFAECLRKRHPHVFWGIVKRPKSHADLHQPVLFPFDTGHLNPVRIALVIAEKAIDGTAAPGNSWPEAFNIWDQAVAPASTG